MLRQRQLKNLKKERECVGTGADPGFNSQESTNKTLTINPFSNICEADEVSPEVEAGVFARLRCLQPYLGHQYVIKTP
jgi:hypothetical protein